MRIIASWHVARCKDVCRPCLLLLASSSQKIPSKNICACTLEDQRRKRGGGGGWQIEQRGQLHL